MKGLEVGSLVKDKISGKKYIVIKYDEEKPQVPFFGGSKGELYCKDENGVFGYKFIAEVSLIKK